MVTMREAFTEQLDDLFRRLAAISRQVEQAVDGASRALRTGEAETAERVISGDEAVDTAREEVEEYCFELLSLQQPVAGDLRVIVAALRMVTELERMGDLSVHVAKIARLRVPNLAVPEELAPMFDDMASTAREMVRQVTDIVEKRDVAQAHELARADETMDALRRQSFEHVFGDDWTEGVEAAVDIALLGRYYERIADHAVSVASRVVYVVTGEKNPELDAADTKP